LFLLHVLNSGTVGAFTYSGSVGSLKYAEKKADRNPKTHMKTLKYTLTLLALVGAFAVSAKADLMFLGAVPFTGANSPDNNHDLLEGFLGFDPGPLADDLTGVGPHDVFPGEFFVVHYGRGQGGSNPGGSWEFFQVINNETSVTFPANGNEAGDDPFGHGGISSIRGFGTPGVPDGGTTVMLLGAALSTLGVARRYLKR
jgi:VPDSG-CTERM motif